MSETYPASFLQGSALEARFNALDSFLIQHQALWRPKPFTQPTLPWEKANPELSSWLRSRSLEEAEATHTHPHALKAPSPFPAWAEEARQLCMIGELPRQYSEAPNRLSVDVPGRKWQQVEAFAHHALFNSPPSHWLDWCSGKGHLGRRLGVHGAAFDCLEYDPSLVETGQRISKRLGLSAHHYEQDVMADSVTERLKAFHTPVALHACGDLHVRLMQVASQTGCPALALAPCCYNRISADEYRPLSANARQSALLLSKEDLGLPLCETVTAGARVRRQRDLSMARRLGFDLLQREIRGADEYLPTPPLATHWLQCTFRDYCLELATLKGLPPIPERNWEALEAAGWKRLAAVRNLELVRGLFRRPLELWLLLDRALFLEEQGYGVRLGSFCDPSLTPRNLMLLAEKP
ncbi:methyltransferase [Pseudomonas sp. JZ134]|uniref:methyltransferase n=1 Tax=Pseudomonas sp. JZ134 TaxID=2806615 RepID=UPI003DA14E16